MSDSKLQNNIAGCFHCDIAVLLPVLLCSVCMCCVQWLVLGYYLYISLYIISLEKCTKLSTCVFYNIYRR